MPKLNLEVGIPKHRTIRIHRKQIIRLNREFSETEYVEMLGPNKGIRRREYHRGPRLDSNKE